MYSSFFVVPQKTISCVLPPVNTGYNLFLPPIVVVNGVSVQGNLLFGYRVGCPLSCPTGLFPDGGCQSCIGTSTGLELDALVGNLIQDLTHAQYEADLAFLQIATTYQNTAIESFPIPRYQLSYAQAELRGVVTESSPLKAEFVTDQTKLFSPNILHTFCFNFTMDEALWTRSTDSTGAISFSLDM